METITEAIILGNLLEFYYKFKIVMAFTLPIIVIIGIIIICNYLKQLIELNYRLNENIATILQIKLREEEK